MTDPEPAKREVESTAKKGENPDGSVEDLLVRLLATMLIRVIKKVLTTLSTDGMFRKLLGGKGSK